MKIMSVEKKNKAIEKAMNFLNQKGIEESAYGEVVDVRSDLPFSWVVIFNNDDKQHHVVSEFGALGQMTLHQTTLSSDQLQELIDTPKRASVSDTFKASPTMTLFTLIMYSLFGTFVIDGMSLSPSVELTAFALLLIPALPLGKWWLEGRTA